MDDREKLANLVSNDSAKTSPYEHKDMYWGGSAVWWICAFFFIFIIILLIIIAAEPVCVYGDKDYREKCDDDEPNYGWPLIYAFFITIFVLLIIWLLYAISGRTKSTC